eukprot:5352394-Pleurochrysis_carterae.AAC.1
MSWGGRLAQRVDHQQLHNELQERLQKLEELLPRLTSTTKDSTAPLDSVRSDGLAVAAPDVCTRELMQASVVRFDAHSCVAIPSLMSKLWGCRTSPHFPTCCSFCKGATCKCTLLVAAHMNAPFRKSEQF